MVSDLPLKEIISLIETEYNINLESIDGWKAFIKLRSKVNAFKHRNGMKHFRELDWQENSPLEALYKAHFDDAEFLLDQIAVLLKHLRRLTKPRESENVSQETTPKTGTEAPQ
jgi:hypothetical protein